MRFMTDRLKQVSPKNQGRLLAISVTLVMVIAIVAMMGCGYGWYALPIWGRTILIVCGTWGMYGVVGKQLMTNQPLPEWRLWVLWGWYGLYLGAIGAAFSMALSADFLLKWWLLSMLPLIYLMRLDRLLMGYGVGVLAWMVVAYLHQQPLIDAAVLIVCILPYGVFRVKKQANAHWYRPAFYAAILVLVSVLLDRHAFPLGYGWALSGYLAWIYAQESWRYPKSHGIRVAFSHVGYWIGWIGSMGLLLWVSSPFAWHTLNPSFSDMWRHMPFQCLWNIGIGCIGIMLAFRSYRSHQIRYLSLSSDILHPRWIIACPLLITVAYILRVLGIPASWVLIGIALYVSGIGLWIRWQGVQTKRMARTQLGMGVLFLVMMGQLASGFRLVWINTIVTLWVVAWVWTTIRGIQETQKSK